MALTKPSPAALPADNYARFGAAFDAIDAATSALPGKAAQTALDALSQLLDARRFEYGQNPRRPGDGPFSFTADSRGYASDQLAPLDSAAYPPAVVADGLGIQLTADQVIWSRRYAPCEAGRFCLARWRYTRTTDPVDPSGDAVQLLVAWYGPNKAFLAYTTVSSDLNVTAASGPQDRTAIIGDAGAGDVVVPRPNGAAYFRVGAKSFGNTGRTCVTDLYGEDRTEQLAAFAADLNLGDHKLTHVGAGSDPGDGVNRSQLDAAQNALSALIAALTTRVNGISSPDALSLFPGFEEIWADGVGNAAAGVRTDGRFHLAEMDRELFAYEVPAAVGRDVFVGSPKLGQINLSGGEFPDHVVGACDSGVVSYLGLPGATAAPVQRRTKLKASTTFATRVDTVFGLPVYGQSNTDGTNNYAVISGTPKNPGAALMFNVGARTLGNIMDVSQANTVLPDPYVDSLVDLYEAPDPATQAYGETQCSYAAATFLAAVPSNIGVVAEVHGIGSEPIEALSPGTVPYANLLKGVRRANFLTRLTGRAYAVRYVVWTQGESNAGATQADYYAKLQTLQAALDTDIRRITGQAQPVKLAMDGMSASPSSAVSLAMLQAALAYPARFILSGPRYQFPYLTDALHHTAQGVALLGAQEGRAMAADQTSGAAWLPLYLKTATRSGTVLTLKFNVPAGGTGLVFDTDGVSDPTGGNMGLRFLDNAPGAAESASVILQTNPNQLPQITAPDTITCQLTGAPTGPNPRIDVAQYGGTNAPANGQVTSPASPGRPRACIRDQSPATVAITAPTYAAGPGVGTVTPGTYHLYNWACHGSVPVTGS